MESQQREPENQPGNTKTLESEAAAPTPATAERPKTPLPPSLPPAADEGGAEPVSAETTTMAPATDLEKKLRRAERFGMPVHLTEEEKRSSRAERFGTGPTSPGKNVEGKLEDQKRKARAERFGLTGYSLVDDEEAKKKARLARFTQNPMPDALEEEKRKARAIRFSVTSDSSSQTNGKAKSELTTVADAGGKT